MKNPRIVFMGTPEIGAKILKGLLDNNYNVVGVVTQIDKPVGRKGIITPSPTKVVALEHNIPVFQPVKIRDDFEWMKDLRPDVIITCAYGQIVPQELLDIPSVGSINVHGSLLPKYRGASPIQQALIHGDKESGATIMEMVKEMDAGNMYDKEVIPVLPSDNYTSLYEKVGDAGLIALLRMLPKYCEDKSFGVEQDINEVTFCKKIKKEDEHLSLDYSCDEFVNWVRGLSEVPGGYLLYDGQVFKILECQKLNDKVTHEVGCVIEASKKGLILQLKDGQVSLLKVQKQGKSKMDYKSFVNGESKILNKVLL